MNELVTRYERELLENVTNMGDTWTAYRTMYRADFIEPYSLK